MSSECSSNAECLNDGLKECIGINNDNSSFFCDCSPKFGWTGEDCDEASPALIFNAIASGVLIFTGIPLFIFCCWLLNLYVSKYKEKKCAVLRRIILLLSTVLLAYLCLMTTFSLDLVSYVNPSKFKVEDDEIVSEYVLQRNTMDLIALLLILFSGVQLIVVWLSYICDLSSHFPEKTLLKGNQLRIGVIVVMVVLIVVGVTCFALGEFELYRSFLVGLAGIGVILYTIGYFYLTWYLKNLIKSLKSVFISEFFQLITFTYRLNLSALFVLIVFGVLRETIGDKYEENLQSGEFNYSILFLFVMNISLYVLLTSVSRFCLCSQPWEKAPTKVTKKSIGNNLTTSVNNIISTKNSSEFNK